MVSASYALDVSDPREILAYSPTVLLSTVEHIAERAQFSSNDGNHPETSVTISVIEMLKGEAPPADVILVPGGVVTEQEAFEAMPLERAQRIGLADRSAQLRESTLLRYVSETPAELKVGRTYLMMLMTDPTRSIHALGADGYALFEQSGSSLTNPITHQTITIEELRSILG